jgi:hypothetical protein
VRSASEEDKLRDLDEESADEDGSGEEGIEESESTTSQEVDEMFDDKDIDDGTLTLWDKVVAADAPDAEHDSHRLAVLNLDWEEIRVSLNVSA